MRQGVENVYTQHSPPLVGLLERLVRGRLPELDYPRAERNASPQAPKVRAERSLGVAVGGLGGQ